MLKEIKKIRETIKTKEEELEVATNQHQQFLDQVAEPKFTEAVANFFNGFSSKDVTLKVSSSGRSISFLRPEDGSSYDKELMSLYVREDWNTGELEKIDTSVYSTSDNSLFELERLQLVGEVASILIDFQDDILAALNQCRVSLLDEKKALRDARSVLEQEINSLEVKINSMFLGAAEEKLNSEEGMVFDKERRGAVDVAWDNRIAGIRRARILSKTASGKSATLELTTESWWKDETEIVTTYKNVRMSNVSELLHQYRDRVLDVSVK